MPGDYHADAAAQRLYRVAFGGGTIMERKPTAQRNIGTDIDARAIGQFSCGYRVKLAHGYRHDYLFRFAYDGTEPVYANPPYLKLRHNLYNS